MRKLATLIISIISLNLFAQVGIGAVNPKAQLDISASNQATPANTDGILIPRIDAFPTTNPTVDQNGMLVFLTTDKTFYYWDHANTTWIAINNPNGAVEKIDDLTDGKSDETTFVFLGKDAGVSNTANNNVGVGIGALKSNTTGNNNTAIGFEALKTNTAGHFNTAYGSQSLFSTAENGLRNTANGFQSLYNNGAGDNNTALGYQSGYSATTGNHNIFLGFSAGYFETGSNKLYVENTSADADNALIYGEFDTNILRTNSEFQIGVPTTGTGYAFPKIDGTANQVLETNGTGQLAWVDHKPVSSINMWSSNAYTMNNTSGQDLTNIEAALEPSMYNSAGNIEVKLVIRYSNNSAVTTNFQLRAHDGTGETYPILNTDSWTWSSTQTGGVITSQWKTWSAGTNAQEIHLFGWVDSNSIDIKNVYLLVKSQ